MTDEEITKRSLMVTIERRLFIPEEVSVESALADVNEVIWTHPDVVARAAVLSDGLKGWDGDIMVSVRRMDS